MTYQDRLTSPESGGASATERARDTATAGRDQAQQVASTAADQARDVATTARDEAQHVAQTAQGQARRLAHDARDELRSQADSQVERVADGLANISNQLRTMGERGDPGPAADLAGQAAYRTQQMADRLRSGGLDDAIGQLRDFGRNRPGLFLLGAFGAGLAAGRVVRNLSQESSSSSRTPSSGNGHGNGSGYATYGRESLSPPPPSLEADPYGQAPPVAGPGPAVRTYVGPDDGTEYGTDTPAQEAYGAPVDPDRGS